MDRTGRRLVIVIYIIALAVGTSTHINDIVTNGILPYRNAPMWLNIYWTTLTLLDPLAILLLCIRLRAGVFLTLATMVTDVAFNSYAGLVIWKISFFQNVPLLLQAAFLAFVVLTAPRLLHRR